MEDEEIENSEIAQNKLKLESSLFFKIMLENATSTSVLILDKKGIILNINFAFQKHFGYSKNDIIGKNFSFLFIEEDQTKELPQKEIESAIINGSALDNNYILHKDGSQIWVSGESIYTKDDQGQEFLMKIIQDINKQKLLEDELKQKNEDQKKVINDRNTFVYTASHDLMAPINNIEGLIKFLEPDLPSDGEPKFLIDTIYSAINKFRHTLRELSFIGRQQDQENIKIIDDNIEFIKVYEDVLIQLNREIKSSGAQITSDFENAPVVKFLNKNLKSIILNLLSNAIKYSSPDRKPLISITTEQFNDKYILLSVKDNGIGMKEGSKDVVFEMYGRLHTHVEGTGVGMAMVKRIVENAGGKIDLESEEGVGSTFKIYFANKVIL